MKHRILITNDDGITAPGLAVMERIARQISDDVWIVAPDFEKSGAGRSVSIAEPIRIRQYDERRYSLLRGTPADCAIVGLRTILRDNPPTLVLSGVNRGSNLAEDLTYSGTVAGAMEAAQHGIRAIAMSQYFDVQAGDVNWDSAEHHGRSVVEALLSIEPPRGVFHNVNFPSVAPDQVRGIRVTEQGRWGRIQLDVHDRIDARNFPYAWLSFFHEAGEPEPHTDLGATFDGWISVTPLDSDLTHRDSLEQLRAALARV